MNQAKLYLLDQELRSLKEAIKSRCQHFILLSCFPTTLYIHIFFLGFIFELVELQKSKSLKCERIYYCAMVQLGKLNKYITLPIRLAPSILTSASPLHSLPRRHGCIPKR